MTNKKIIFLNETVDGDSIVLNFKEDFMEDMVKAFTGIYNWMTDNDWDNLTLKDGTLIRKDSINEVIDVTTKLSIRLCGE